MGRPDEYDGRPRGGDGEKSDSPGGPEQDDQGPRGSGALREADAVLDAVAAWVAAERRRNDHPSVVEVLDELVEQLGQCRDLVAGAHEEIYGTPLGGDDQGDEADDDDREPG
jgi:hypothetical protein